MSLWRRWTDEVFSLAQAQGKPVLAVVGTRAPEALGADEALIERLFIAVLVDPEERPDAAGRIGRGHAVVLDPSGARRAVLPLPAPGLREALERLAAEAVSRGGGRPEPEVPAWTGAVRREPFASALGEDLLARSFAAARAAAAAGEPGLDVLEALVYSASERGDREARALLEGSLGRLLGGPCWDRGLGAFRVEGESALTANARRCRLLWDAHASTGEARWREAAEASSLFLMKGLREPAVFAADAGAQASRALLRAAAFEVPGAAEAAETALVFLRTRLYDPLLGLRHSSDGPGASVFGLLSDAAWTALAFAEASQASGLKTHREFADALLRFLFQESWERDGGGFLDRVPRAADPLILREPRLDPGLNAVALEVCWRLHQLKGNANYRRWLDWGLRGVWPAAAPGAAGLFGLARVADMAARGRLDFELVGRVGSPRGAELLRAAVRQYAPRAIISIVDPDDQDYILAHKLTAEPYPRLFGCGADLRRIFDTDDPSRVGEVFAAARAAEGA